MSEFRVITMDRYDIDYARAHLDELIARARQGEAVEIVDKEQRTVTLSAAGQSKSFSPPPQPGQWKGKLQVPARLFEPLTDAELAELEGETAG
jgi:antitoxin (DNA-binding transcriptional repressor) of toxin-antitoxin stability system